MAETLLAAHEVKASVIARARAVALDVARQHATDVDAKGRFPAEAIAALKQARLLSAYVPRELGGDGCSLLDLTTAGQVLGQQCAATGMVFAMHQIQVASLVRHAKGSAWFHSYLRALSDQQLLIASVTSEVGTGGDLRSSICALEPEGPNFKLTKQATTVSYGAESDALLLTCRRAAESAANDQVMVLLRKSETTLKQTTQWDTLGMRGTCSPGFTVSSHGSLEQVLPTTFAEICPQTQVPFSHILWSGVWLGIATDAVNRAAAFVRGEARKKPGFTPPGAMRLAEATSVLQTMRNNVHGVARECDALMSGPDGADALSGLGFVLKMNNLKISCSQLVVQIVGQALGICGIAGYKNDGKFSLGRHLRDAHSAALMINNDRIHATNAQLLLVHKDD